MFIIRAIIAYIICLIGVILPWRIRIFYAEALGWTVQQVYLAYVSILKFIIRDFKELEE